MKGKPAESQNLAKAAKPASVDAEDDDEHNELEGRGLSKLTIFYAQCQLM